MLAANLAHAEELVDDAGIQATQFPRVSTLLADDTALAETDSVYHG
jgi:hypothetical protein